MLRLALDAIGYSTAPEDAEVARGLLEQFLVWVMGLPAWLPWAFVGITTLWLAWVSWPRPQPLQTPNAAAAKPAFQRVPSEGEAREDEAATAVKSDPQQQDPEIFRNRDVYLTTLIVDQQRVRNRIFDNCTIHGPALIWLIRTVIDRDCKFYGSEKDDSIMVTWLGQVMPSGTILVKDCVFRNCTFKMCSILNWSTKRI